MSDETGIRFYVLCCVSGCYAEVHIGLLITLFIFFIHLHSFFILFPDCAFLIGGVISGMKVSLLLFISVIPH